MKTKSKLITGSLALLATTGGLAIPAAGSAPPSASAPNRISTQSVAPVYEVVSEGVTAKAAKKLAKRAGIANALRPDGAVSFVAAKQFAAVPAKHKPNGKIKYVKAKDERGQTTKAPMVDVKALSRVKIPTAGLAVRRANNLLGLPAGYSAVPKVGHTQVEVADKSGRITAVHRLDTTVSRQLHLDGVPVVGPGAKSRVSLVGKQGKVAQLTQSVRKVRKGQSIPIISVDAAVSACSRLYGQDVQQGKPTLAYYAPALGAVKGGVRQLLPHYVCDPSNSSPDEAGALTGRLVPASSQATPKLTVVAEGSGQRVSAGVRIDGGTAPYSIRWLSSTTAVDPGKNASSVQYQRTLRQAGADERITVVVTDANGIQSNASVRLAGGRGSAEAEGLGGAGGVFASVGIEQTIDEWQCAQDSANGFKSVMQSKGQQVKFDWRGWNAFESDFKSSLVPGGNDRNWVDSVDAQWYTGHGNANGFTFKGNNTDGSITPADARWGDNFNLEWLMLESCQVLRDTNGRFDHLSRWAPAFDGLHLINGFHTNAYCVDGGTGRRFAEYLFPRKFLFWTRPAMTVQKAWAAMANDLEPAGVRWRTMSAMSKTGAHNLGDYYWGQGPVGPDIRRSQQGGFISVSGLT